MFHIAVSHKKRKVTVGWFPFYGLQENVFAWCGPHLLTAILKRSTRTWNRKCSECFNTIEEGHGKLDCGSQWWVDRPGPALPSGFTLPDISRCCFRLLPVRHVCWTNETEVLSGQKNVFWTASVV
jgi:hypothetical protein